MFNFKNLFRNRYLCMADIVFCVVAYFVAIAVTCPLAEFDEIYMGYLIYAIFSAAVYVCVLNIFGVYQTYWMYAGTIDYLRLILALLIPSIICDVVYFAQDYLSLFYKTVITANVFALFFIIFERLAVRLACKLLHMVRGEAGKRVLIVGAGQLATALLRDINANERLRYTVVGLIDDANGKKNQFIYGAKVLGNRKDIERICREKRVDEIIFAIGRMDTRERTKVLNICSVTGCKVRVMPSIEEILEKNMKITKMRDLQIEDLLERDAVRLDNKKLTAEITGKVVLVTGGGGSIGSELCRQIVMFKPKLLVILDIYENTTYELQNEINDNYPDQKLAVVIASIRDSKRINEVFDEYKPQMVFHAAAHKHVPLMEYNPSEAIKNNIFGTYNVAKAADEHNVNSFVMISTDKAVNPTNVMGATKRFCEMIIQAFSKRSKTVFTLVRFGNVLGSNGSVIPRFKKQISEGGPVTVTHKDITRFFMTIPEAAQLVLQAGSYAKGGEIFVLDMGEPVKIYDLAKKMIVLMGYKPDVDIKIELTGLRPGEKLYEEILMDEEGLNKTEHNKIFIGQPIKISETELARKMEKLSSVLDSDVNEVKRVLSEVVPTYTMQVQDSVIDNDESNGKNFKLNQSKDNTISTVQIKTKVVNY